MKEMIDREASMFPKHREAFELMKSEKPLISFEMNQNEMDKVAKVERT